MAKKARKPIVEYLLSSGIVLAVSLMFSVISLVFLAVPWKWLQFIVSFVFIAPVLFLAYSHGKGQGEKLYKKSAETSLTNLHNSKGILIPKHKCVFHMIAFAAPLFILTLLTVILKNTGLHFVIALFVMPVTMMFTSVGAININDASLPGYLNWSILVIYTLYILLICGAFVFGYLRRLAIMKRQQRDIEGELRMFNN